MEVDLWVERVTSELRALNFSQSTLNRYRSEVPRFLRFLEKLGVSSLAGLTRSHLQAYRQELCSSFSRGRLLTVANQRARLGAALGFTRFLVRNDYLLLDATRGLALPKPGKTLPRVILSEAETTRFLETPEPISVLGLRDRAISEMLYGTGMRNSELRDLLLEHVDWSRHLVFIARGKGNKSRWVPLGEEAESWLSEYVQKARPQLARSHSGSQVFLSRSGRILGCTPLAELVARRAVLAGIQKHVTPHVLRHSCATHMLKRGAGLRYLQTLLGHECLNTTQIYTRVELSELRKVLLRCHPRERQR